MMPADTRTPEQRARDRAEMDAADAAPDDRPRRTRPALRVAPTETIAPVVDLLGRRIAIYRTQARDLRAGACLRCTSPDTEPAASCAHRGSDDDTHGVDTAALCKHAAELARRSRRADVRRARLRAAGIRHPRILELFPDAVEPPMPAVPAHELRVASIPIRAAQRFLDVAGMQNLTLIGDSGAGKTWAAAWIVAGSNAALVLPFASVQSFEAWREVASRAARAPVLVIQDLGIGDRNRSQTWIDGLFEGLIAARDDEGLRTVITTNLPMERGSDKDAIRSIRERYGDRVVSRLTGRGSAVIECMGGDLRKVGRKVVPHE